MADTVTVLSQPCCDLRGDFDHNGTLDLNDLMGLAWYVNSNGWFTGCWQEADVDGDGHINGDDVDYLIAYFYHHGQPPADCP